MNLGQTLIASSSDTLAHTAAHLVASWIQEIVAQNRIARIALSGGSTPRAMNRILAGLPLPWASTEWFWVDDRFVEPQSPRSNLGAARTDLFDRLTVSPQAIHGMPFGPDIQACASTYEEILKKSFVLPGPGAGPLPAFDLLLLGVGDDGHTASLFPGDPSIDEVNRWVIPVREAEGREARLTLSRPVITAAKRVVVLAQGASKREPLRRAREQGSLHEIPSRLVQEVQGELFWLLDTSAAGY